MDIQTLIASTVIAALVASTTSIIMTRYSLKVQRRKDKFDRLFLVINEIRAKITDFRLSAGNLLNEKNAPDSQAKFQAIMNYQKLQDEIVIYYEKNKMFFESKHLGKVEESFDGLKLASLKRNTNEDWIKSNMEDSMNQYKVYQAAFDNFILTLTEMTESQLKELNKL